MARKPNTTPPTRGKTLARRASVRRTSGQAARQAAPAGDDALAPWQLAGAPLGLAAEQMTRWMQLSNQLAASLLDVQAAWFRQAEAAAAQMLTPLVTRGGRITFGSAQDIVEPPGPNGPMQAVWSAQKLWSESAKAWLSAVSHDLQERAPAR